MQQLATPKPLPPPPPLHTSPRGDDRYLSKKEFQLIENLTGKQFSIDCFCNPTGSNALVSRFHSPRDSFFNTTSLAHQHVWVNPPFNLIEPGLKHYLALKAKSPETTSGCFLVPRWPGATWNPLLQGMQVLTSYPIGFPLFHMDRAASENTATPAIPWPVDVYYDPIYQPHSVKMTQSREQAEGQPLPMHFKATVSGTPAVAALDSQATHCFIDKQFAQRAGLKCTPAHRMVQLADGSHTQIAAECNIHLKLFPSERGERHYSARVPCLVIDLGADHNVILGQNWLHQEGAVMSFHTHSCELVHRDRLLLTPTSHTREVKFIKPTLSAMRVRKAVADGARLLKVQVEAMPGLPPQPSTSSEALLIPESVSPEVRKLLLKHAHVFGKREGLPPDRGTFLTIPEMPGASPQFKHPYRLSRTEVLEVETQVKELLRQGLIEPSNSPYGAPIIFVQKKDGTLRMCCDWRKLNAQTIKSRYPLPRIDELLDSLQGAKFFSSLDLQSGYHQILIHPEDAPKTAFTTPFGHYQWKVMSFGLCNAPAIFQETMNTALAPLLRKGALVYMDDILIYAKTREEHARILDEALTLLDEKNFYVKLSKCDFEQHELKFLGHIIGQEGIKVDPAKTQVVKDWPTPSSVKDIRSFLGLSNYFRKFVQGYSTLVEPLTALTRKELIWNNQTWDTKCEQAFQGVKTALTNAPTLIMPNLAQGNYEVICDASLVGIGAVLTQEGKPIAYESSKFSPAERNWTTGEQELWAVIHALQTWRCYLEGVPFKVITDHNPLTHLPTQANLTRKQARWSQYLQQFEFEWEYRPGRTNVADPLSRIPNINGIALNAITLGSLSEARVTRSQTGSLRRPAEQAPEAEEPSRKRKREQKKAPEEPAPAEKPEHEVAPPFSEVDQPAVDLLTLLQNGYLTDEWFLEENNRKAAGLRLQDGLWLTLTDQVAVPNVPGLRQGIIYELHDASYSGHPGIQKTQKAIHALYWWPKWATEVKEYVLTCASCQRNKSTNQKPAGLLQPLAIPRHKWASVSMDFITQLPPTGGPVRYDAIVVFVDRLTKMVRIAPTTSDVNSEGTAQLLYDNVFKHHGVPSEIISDRGSVFTSKLYTEFMRKLETKQKKSVAFHPQTDGQTERTNQTLETMLRHYVGSRTHGDWHLCLTAAEFAINNAFTPTIGTTPFLLNYGRNPRLPVSVAEPKVLKAQDWADRMIFGLAEAKRHIRLAQERQKKHYDKNRRDVTYHTGDQVFLNSRNISLRRAGDKSSTMKLMPKWLGPFTISEVIGKGAYRLELPETMRAHNVFNVVSLKPYLTDGRAQPPPPLLIDGEEEFFLELILQHSVDKNGALSYLVKWRGYGPEYNTWQSAKSVDDNEAVEIYWQAQGLEAPVQATSKGAIKLRTAKLVHAAQALSFPLGIELPDLPCWKLLARNPRPSDLGRHLDPILCCLVEQHEPRSSTDSQTPTYRQAR